MPRLSRTPGVVRHTGPDTGADTRRVLAELGLDDARIDQLMDRGTVAEPTR